MAILPHSRYRYCHVYQDVDDGLIYLDVPFEIPTIPDRFFYLHTVEDRETLWSIAWKYWKSMLDYRRKIRPTSFFWVISTINGIVDVTETLQVGSVLMIPNTLALQTYITASPAAVSREKL